MVGYAGLELAWVGVQGKRKPRRVCMSGCIHAAARAGGACSGAHTSERGSPCTSVHVRASVHRHREPRWVLGGPSVGFGGTNRDRPAQQPPHGAAARTMARHAGDAGASPRHGNGVGLGHSCVLGITSAGLRHASGARSKACRR